MTDTNTIPDAASSSQQRLNNAFSDDHLNIEYYSPQTTHSSSSLNSARLFFDAGNRGECSNQQVIYANAEISSSQSQPTFRVSRPRDRHEKDCCSIVIPVGGTLSRPIKKKTTANNELSEFKSTIKDRVTVMYMNEWLADVYFLVGTGPSRERIPAHSFVLSVASSPFAAMFHGGFDSHAEIEIPDVEPCAFKILLKYLYTDEIELRADCVLATLYTAKKYLISYLCQAAVDFLDANLNASNVCSLLMQGRLFEEEELVKRCWEVVDANAEKVLCSEGFLETDFALLKQILSRETLIVREKTVYEAVMKWAKAECKRRNVFPSAEEVRSILGDVMYCIRFPAMTISEFANEPSKSDLLTCQEINDIFHHFLALEKPSLPFPALPRKGLPLSVCTRFQGALRGTNQWRYCGRCDSIQFLVDRRIFVAGYGLYGSSSGPSEYKVKMELKKSKEVLESIETSFCSSGLPISFPVRFTNPVQIDADVVYTASVTMEGKELSHFGHDGMSEVSVHVQRPGCLFSDIVNFYFTPSDDSKNGTGVQGGQIPEIMFYA